MRIVNNSINLLISVFYLTTSPVASAGPIKPIIGLSNGCTNVALGNALHWSPPPIDLNRFTPAGRSRLEPWLKRLPQQPHFVRESGSNYIIGYRGEPHPEATLRAHRIHDGDWKTGEHTIQSVALILADSGRIRIQFVADDPKWFETIKRIMQLELDRDYDAFQNIEKNSVRPGLHVEQRNGLGNAILYFEVTGNNTDQNENFTYELLLRITSAYFHFPSY